MAIVDYSYSQIESGFSGFFDDITNTGYRCFSTRGMWCGIITGTEASMHVWAGGDYPYSVIVDGSFSATPIISSGRITLFSGLSDAPHLVSIHVQGAYAPIYNAIRESWTDALRVDGASPSFSAVPVTIPNDPSANILNSQPSIAWTGDNSNVRPTWTTTATNYTEGDTKALGMVIFRAQCSDIYIYASSQNFRYSVDGGTIQSVSLTDYNTGQARLLPLATGLDDTAVHEYRIWPDETSGSTAYIHGVAAFDDGVPVSLSAIDNKTHIAQFGDSITAGEGATTGAVDCWLYGNDNDYLITQCGVTGDTSLQVAGRISAYMAEIPMPDYALLATGRNDDMDVEANFKPGYEDLCDAVVAAGIPATICRGQLPGTASTSAIANLEEWIQEVIASYSGFQFLDTSDWDEAATADGLHPTAAGYQTINGDEAPAIAALLPGSTDDLTASDLTGAAPTLDSPAISQVHALGASDLDASAPTLDSSSVGQVHDLAASDLIGGSPVIDSPTIGTEGQEDLTAADLMGATPVLDSPNLGQVHALTAEDLIGAEVIFEDPAIGQLHVLAAGDLTAGTPTLDSPHLGQLDELIAVDLYGGVPVLGSPELTEGEPSEVVSFIVRLSDRSARIAITDESSRVRLNDRSSRIEFSEP